MNCDAIAPYYYFLEWVSFGSALERARFAFLPEIASSRRALLCGDGDGRFLAQLLRSNAEVQVDFVDLSTKMVKIAEQRILTMGKSFRRRVRFHIANVADFIFPESAEYDLIVTHFFLDCFSEDELKGVVGEVVRRAAPGARWVVSEFREIPGPVLRLCSAAVIRSLYAAFRLSTGLRITRLPDYCVALSNAGFRPQQEKHFAGGLLHASLWMGRGR
ncbi:MAG: class I SAM-dependent methyltransferase [Candidatus Acidiferrum sp.]